MYRPPTSCNNLPIFRKNCQTSSLEIQRVYAEWWRCGGVCYVAYLTPMLPLFVTVNAGSVLSSCASFSCGARDISRVTPPPWILFPCREDDDEETPGQVRRSVSIQVSERSDALALSTLSRAREVWFPVWSLGLGWSFWTCKILSFEVLSGDCKKVHSNSGSKIEWSFRDFPVQSLSSYLR